MKRTVFECDICGAVDEHGDKTKGIFFPDNGLINPPEKFRLVDPLHTNKHVCENCIDIIYSHRIAEKLEEEMSK